MRNPDRGAFSEPQRSGAFGGFSERCGVTQRVRICPVTKARHKPGAHCPGTSHSQALVRSRKRSNLREPFDSGVSPGFRGVGKPLPWAIPRENPLKWVRSTTGFNRFSFSVAVDFSPRRSLATEILPDGRCRYCKVGGQDDVGIAWANGMLFGNKMGEILNSACRSYPKNPNEPGNGRSRKNTGRAIRDGGAPQPGSELPGVNPGRSRKKNGVTPPRRVLAFARKCRYLLETKDADQQVGSVCLTGLAHTGAACAHLLRQLRHPR